MTSPSRRRCRRRPKKMPRTSVEVWRLARPLLFSQNKFMIPFCDDLNVPVDLRSSKVSPIPRLIEFQSHSRTCLWRGVRVVLHGIRRVPGLPSRSRNALAGKSSAAAEAEPCL